MNIQEEVQKIHLHFGTSEMANYKIQLLFDKQCETICDDFAIGFYEWRSTSHLKNIDQYTNKELLQIYKDEKSI